MEKKHTVPIMVTIHKTDRDLLRRLAAERNLHNPDEITTVASLVREILSNYIDDQMNACISDDQ